MPARQIVAAIAAGSALWCAACGGEGPSGQPVSHPSASSGSAEREVIGIRAGGLDAGSEVGAKFDIHRNRLFTLGMVFIENRGTAAAIVEEARVIPRSSAVEVTHGRIWVIPRGVKDALPGGDPEWPPAGYPGVSKLPDRDVTIPRGRTAQVMFAVASMAPAGTTVQLMALRVRFHQGGASYVWTLPLPVTMKTLP